MSDQPQPVEAVEDSPIAVLKIAEIERIAADQSLTKAQAWDLIGEILEAPGWTVHHVLHRQRERASR